MDQPPPYQATPEEKPYPPPEVYPPPQQGQQHPPPQGGVYPPPQAGAYPPLQAGVYPPPQPAGAYPPPAQAGTQTVYPPQSAPAATVVVQQPGILVQGVVSFGEHPQNIICPTCQSSVITLTSYTAGTLTYLIACLLCFIFWPCACIPCCIDACKDVTHQCPSCQNIVGHYKRM